MAAVMVYVTFGQEAQAHEVACALVEKRLIACANIFPPMKSVYRWEGKIESGDEIAAIFKTTEEKLEEVKEAILDLHSFDTPCIVVLPIEGGYQPFLEWIGQQTDVC